MGAAVHAWVHYRRQFTTSYMARSPVALMPSQWSEELTIRCARDVPPAEARSPEPDSLRIAHTHS